MPTFHDDAACPSQRDALRFPERLAQRAPAGGHPVSPATASFDDVPVGRPYFQFIEALKAAGITGGCQASPPLYCPDRPLTRAEMAVYLSYALGLHWPQ